MPALPVRFHSRWLLLVLMAGAVLALSMAARGAELKLLRVGTAGDYAPFSTAQEGKPAYRGFDIAVAEAFAHDCGYTIEWVAFRWPALNADLAAGRFDVAMSGITVRPERSAIGRFSVPVMTSGAVLLYKIAAFDRLPAASLAITPESLSRFDRAGVHIAVNQGGHLEQVTRAHFSKATVLAIPDNAGVRLALVDGTADAVVTDSLEAPHWLKALSGVATFGPFTEDRKAYWWAADKGVLAGELDSWLVAREANGTLAHLRAAVLGISTLPSTADPLHALLAAIDERLALMPWVARSKRAGGIAIEDRAQESRVLAASWQVVQHAAQRAELEPPGQAQVTALYGSLIEAAKQVQHRAVESNNGPQNDEPHAKASDLQEVLRPALLRIDERLAGLIVALHQEPAPANLTAETAHALRAHELEQASLAEINAAISAIPRQTQLVPE